MKRLGVRKGPGSPEARAQARWLLGLDFPIFIPSVAPAMPTIHRSLQSRDPYSSTVPTGMRDE